MVGRKALYSIELNAKKIYDQYLEENPANDDFELQKNQIKANIRSSEYKKQAYMREYGTSGTLKGDITEKKEYRKILLENYYLEEDKLGKLRLDWIRLCGDIVEAKTRKMLEKEKNLTEGYILYAAKYARLNAQLNEFEKMEEKPIATYLCLRLEFMDVEAKKTALEWSRNNPLSNSATEKETQLHRKQHRVQELETRVRLYQNEYCYCDGMGANNLQQRSYYLSYAEELQKRYEKDVEELNDLRIPIILLLGETLEEKNWDEKLYLRIPEQFLNFYRQCNARYACLNKQCNELEKLEQLPTELYFDKKIELIHTETELERLNYIIRCDIDDTDSRKKEVFMRNTALHFSKKEIARYQNEIKYIHALKCSDEEKAEYARRLTILYHNQTIALQESAEKLEEAEIKLLCKDDYKLIKERVDQNFKTNQL